MVAGVFDLVVGGDDPRYEVGQRFPSPGPFSEIAVDGLTGEFTDFFLGALGYDDPVDAGKLAPHDEILVEIGHASFLDTAMVEMV